MTTPHLFHPTRQRSAMTGATGLRNGMYLPSMDYLNRIPGRARERSLPASFPWIHHRPDNVSKLERERCAELGMRQTRQRHAHTPFRLLLPSKRWIFDDLLRAEQ